MSSPSVTNDDITYNCKFFQIHQNGTVKVHHPMLDRPIPPPSQTQHRDVVVSESENITARIFLPKLRPGLGSEPNPKLPIVLYIHGGGFCMLSPYAAIYHRHCTQLCEDTYALVVSVDYGLFPTRPIPACYDDSWEALKWVGAHSTGSGPDPWLTTYGDFNMVFIAGDSAGGNIAHSLAIRVGSSGLDGAKLVGVLMTHPFFGGTVGDEIWMKMCPTNKGLDDPRLNPSEEDLVSLGCERVLIFVAENDLLCQTGEMYYEKLKKSGWKGKVEIHKSLGREHVFHIFKPVEGDEEAVVLRRLVAAFVRGEGWQIQI